MQIGYALVQFGSVYVTDNGLVGGERYITEIEGLEQFALTDKVGSQAALDFTRYLQYQAVKDQLVVVRVPKSDFAKFDAVRDVIQTAVTGLTTYTLNITINGEAFTFTAKPGDPPISYKNTDVMDALEMVEFRQYCSD